MTDESATDAFGNPTAPNETTPGPDETQNSELGVDWGDGQRTPFSDDDAVLDAGDGDFDAKNFFDWLPTDIEVSHADRPIIENFAQHMHGHSMTPTQVHEAIRWANGYEGDNLEQDFSSHMGAHGVTVAQAQEAKKWFDAYAGSDDAALAKVDAAIEQIETLMGTPAYTKDPQMQENYRILLEVRDGDGEA